MKPVPLGLAVILGSLIPPLLPAGEITTREGKTYPAAEVERVEPDGIILSYQPPGGGLGSAKLKFAILPENLQREYAYDPQKAAAFETDQVHAQQTLQKKFWSEYEDATNHIAIRRIEEEKQAEIEARENAELQARQAQAEQERIAKESKMKAESALAQTQPYYDPQDPSNPLIYQPSTSDGMYRPPLPLDQVPLIPEKTSAAKQTPIYTGKEIIVSPGALVSKSVSAH